MTAAEAVLLFFIGAVASGINAVAGGGSLISFPVLRFAIGLPSTIANATNSVALWPGSLGGAFGFINLIKKTSKYLRLLLLPTILGSTAGAFLLVKTDPSFFDLVVPWLILFAALLLLLQPMIKKRVLRDGRRTLGPHIAVALQFLVSVYGGYFGAGMGIMMLAAFALYIEGTVHELNAVKNWLGLVVNFTCSMVFIVHRLVDPKIGLVLAAGSIVGGFFAARVSQRFDPDRVRTAIAVYGVAMAAYYLARSWHLV